MYLHYLSMVSGPIGSIKELTMSLHQDPLGTQTNHVCLTPTGEGAPSKSEGVGGVFRMGLRGRVPLTGGGRRPRSL